MDKRHDSGSNSSPDNRTPNAPNEERLPEPTDNARGLGDDDADDFDDEDLEEEEQDEEEGTL